jgi:hypothetical protein
MLKLLLILCLAQDLKLPAKVETQPAAFVKITAETKGETVKFVSLDKNLELLPAELLADKKICVAVAKIAGRYKIMAYTYADNKLSDPAFTEVIVGDNVTGDKLFEILEPIYGADISKTKSADLQKLITTFNIIQNTNFNATKTLGEAFNSVELIFKQANVSYESLRTLRDAIGDYLLAQMGNDSNAVFDPVKFKKCIQDTLAALTKLGGA